MDRDSILNSLGIDKLENIKDEHLKILEEKFIKNEEQINDTNVEQNKNEEKNKLDESKNNLIGKPEENLKKPIFLEFDKIFFYPENSFKKKNINFLNKKKKKDFNISFDFSDILYLFIIIFFIFYIFIILDSQSNAYFKGCYISYLIYLILLIIKSKYYSS